MKTRRKQGRTPDRARTDYSLRSERVNVDDARKGIREADADVAAAGHRALSARGGPGTHSAEADLEGVIEEQANALQALDALIVHERAATDAYLLTELARSDDAVANRDDFLGMVAHDVRNLLNLVVLSLELLRPAGRPPDPQQVEGAADRIRRYVARMNRLIGDLVDVTSIDAGRLAMHLVAGDAGSLVVDATETFQPAAAAKGVSLAARKPAAPVPAVFDHDRLLQVLANVISNAIKFTPQGGTVTVAVEPSAGVVGFVVSDTGSGIPANMLEAIFQRFWQVAENDRRGMGLGLYISKSIVEGHGGRIWAESAPGQGTRLHFTLPMPAPAAAPSP